MPSGGQPIQFNETIIVQGDLDNGAAEKIRTDREVQLNKLYDNLRELNYRGRLQTAIA
jgi:hypothetical protein